MIAYENQELYISGAITSLATAGYGTALGVIRALHAEGILEKCYCTETRPYNQASKNICFSMLSIEKVETTH